MAAAGLALIAGLLHARGATAAFAAPIAAAQAGDGIRHLVPAPDSSGDVPARFEWTPVKGADRYAINVFNEIDIPVWQQDDLREPRVDWPKELRVESGTYFWVIAALKDDRPIAQSGRAAFVVLR
jgi:hypothetical protein